MPPGQRVRPAEVRVGNPGAGWNRSKDTMNQYFDVIGLVAVATLFGSMAFFSAVIAPLVFVKLEPVTAGRFIRAVFPWYYATIGGLAVIGAGMLAAVRPIDAAIMGAIALGALLSRQILMPQINRFRHRVEHRPDRRRGLLDLLLACA